MYVQLLALHFQCTSSKLSSKRQATRMYSPYTRKVERGPAMSGALAESDVPAASSSASVFRFVLIFRRIQMTIDHELLC